MLHVVPVHHCWEAESKEGRYQSVDLPQAMWLIAEVTLAVLVRRHTRRGRQEVKAGLSDSQAVHQRATAEGASEAACSRGGQVNRAGGRQTCAVDDTAFPHVHRARCGLHQGERPATVPREGVAWGIDGD